MIRAARVPADRPVRIAFSLDGAPDATPPEDAAPPLFPELDQQLQPLPPRQDSLESMQVFRQHCQIAEEYHEVRKEIALLEERKKELMAKLAQAEKEKVDAAQLAREFEALTEENRALKLAQSQCVEQLEKLRVQYQKRQGSS
ncbi:MAP3K7 C-terminal-like protein isoform X1 [Artibeus jamaicensis]|uniref:MAP3K7 C-terminal-like protein isoform X1 n=1 Tax=Artibeus jamaicensis TaxID=9417 RepID=UPI00187CE4CA|nr:MAP3K7 C-terminal-like protein isoform X1 [Artibeus jamaicensis]